MHPTLGSVCRGGRLWAALAFFLLSLLLRCAGRPVVGLRHDGTWLLKEVEDTCRPVSHAGATWGIAVRDVKTERLILRKRASQLFVPASNVKLVTTACALELLGPERRFRTVLSMVNDAVYDSSGSAGEIDLVITGSGDPTFGSPDLPCDMDCIFEAWADSLIRRGVTRLSGSIYGCSQPFPCQLPGRSWEWDNLAFHYAATPCGLCWHDNQIDVTVAPGRGVGDPAEMLVAQRISGLHLTCEVVTASPEAERELHLRRHPGSWDMVLTGSLPLEKGPIHLSIAHRDPPSYAAETLRNWLVDHGIPVEGQARVGCLDTDRIIDVATHLSPPLSEIVTITNKETKNLWADQLLILVGLELANSASRDDGIAAFRTCLDDLEMPDSGLRMVDGSGLSRLNLASPDFMTALLVRSQSRPWGTDFVASLPIAGYDGTLRERMTDSSAAGRIKAKTGSMNSVRALSGFAETLSGRQLAFSIMVNGYPGPGEVVDRTIDRICELLVSYETIE